MRAKRGDCAFASAVACLIVPAMGHFPVQRTLRIAVALLVITATPATLEAAGDPVEAGVVAKAVNSGLEVLAKGTINYEEQRSCFTCHHQTLPMLAQATARDHGFKINEALFKQQARITYDGFKDRLKNLRAGTGIGGLSLIHI